MRKFLLVAAVSLVGSACSEEDAGGLRIGALIDQSGSNSETSWVQAVQLAQTHMNAALEAEGYELRFDLRIEDSENNPDVGSERAQILVENGAQALLTDTTQVAEAIGRLLYTDAFSVPLQCSACTSGNLMNPGYVDTNGDTVLQALRNDARKLMFRTTMSTGRMAYVALDVIRNSAPPIQAAGGLDRNADGFVRLSLYGSDEAFGQAGVASLASAANIVFADIVSDVGSQNKLAIERIFHSASEAPSRVDYLSDITRLSDTLIDTSVSANTGVVDNHQPDWIIMVSFASNCAYFRESYVALRSGALPPVLFYHTYRQSNTLFQLGDQVNGSEGVSMVVVSSTSAGAEFKDGFNDAYGFDPHFWDSGFYDNAATIMLGALVGGAGLPEPQSVTAEAIRSGMEQTSVTGGASVTPSVAGFRRAIQAVRNGQPIDYDGASGPMDYDASHNVLNEATHFEAVDGQFVDVDGGSYDCVNGGATCGISPGVPTLGPRVQ